MKSIKCLVCGLVNFETEEFCKKCKSPLNSENQKNLDKTAELLGEFVFQSTVSIMAKALMLIGVSLTSLTVILGLFYKESFGNDFTLMIIIIGVIPALCCAYAAINFFGSRKVKVYRNGLIYKDKSKKHTIFWKEIRNCCETVEWILIEGIPIGRGKVVTLTTNYDKIILGQEIGNLNKVRDYICNNLPN